MKDCLGVAQIGRVRCPDCERASERKRRELKANATYVDLTHLDSCCYICGNAQGLFHADHVLPLARFAAYAEEAEEGEFVSAIRLACASCNLHKSAKDPAVFMLESFRAHPFTAVM